MNKNELRNYYKKAIKDIKNKDIASDIIAEQVLNLKRYKVAKVVCIYSNAENEVSTDKLIEQALKNKIVGVPVVSGDRMDFYQIHSSNDLKSINQFGIKEPESLKKYIKPEDIDLIIVPGVCFDQFGNRIGYGGGYYDQYLMQTGVRAFMVGVCFKEQLILHKIKIDPSDVKMDLVIHN